MAAKTVQEVIDMFMQIPDKSMPVYYERDSWSIEEITGYRIEDKKVLL